MALYWHLMTEKKHNILILGSGGREDALAWKIAQSPLCAKLYIAPGNGGSSAHAEMVALAIEDAAAVIAFCKTHAIALVVVGPETPLVAGLVDALVQAGITAFGPMAAAAQLEGSKGFTKDLCREGDIPTAAYGRFDNADAAYAYLATQKLPIVIKADGLAGGKGVIIAETMAAAHTAIDDIFGGSFGAAGGLVIEEFMHGEEASFFVLCDGETAVPLASAQDYKRVGDGDTGPNTGGMGAYSPASIMTPALIDETMQRIIAPTLKIMAARGTPYRGVLYAGLMLTPDGVRLVEYNCRFGDPECQVLMVRLADDIVPLLLATSTGKLQDTKLNWHDEVALNVVMAAKNYPNAYEKGSVIKGVENIDASQATVFHAGTAHREDGALIAIGGRVLNIVAQGANVAQAQARAYAAIEKIDWPQGFCRSDIGFREIEREKQQKKIGENR